MVRDDSRPQIGKVDVDARALTEPGELFDDLVGRFEIAEPEPAMLVGLPVEGWRVLDRPERGGAIIGAPVDRDGARWRIGEISPGRDGHADRIWVHQEVQPLRRSRAERRAGLQLRWPETTRSETDLGLLAIDIVNAGAERWRPDGDSFHVVGSLQLPGAARSAFYYAYVGGTYPALPLDPGEYLRTRVSVEQNASWDDIEPGSYEVRASLIDLGLQPEPLPIEITAQLVEARRAEQRARRKRHPPPPPPPNPSTRR